MTTEKEIIEEIFNKHSNLTIKRWIEEGIKAGREQGEIIGRLLCANESHKELEKENKDKGIKQGRKQLAEGILNKCVIPIHFGKEKEIVERLNNSTSIDSQLFYFNKVKGMILAEGIQTGRKQLAEKIERKSFCLLHQKAGCVNHKEECEFIIRRVDLEKLQKDAEWKVIVQFVEKEQESGSMLMNTDVICTIHAFTS